VSALAQLSQDIPEVDFSTLSAERLAEIQALVDGSPFSLWAPNPGPQALAYASLADELFYGGAAGGGKLLRNQELIATPKGFVRNGDLRSGDILCDPSTGGQTAVVAVHPQGVKKMYRVFFDDGTHLDAGLEHLWLYRPNAHKRRKPNSKVSEQRDYAEETLGASPLLGQKNIPWRVGTTEDFIRYLDQGVNCRIPLTRPLVFTKFWRPFEVDPYLYGLFLGDGHLKSMTLTNIDPEIHELMQEIGATQRDEKNWYLPQKGHKIGTQMRQYFTKNGLRDARSWEKFVPESLKWGRIEDRLAVLQGLMDTDGTMDDRGRAYYISTSRRLAEDVAFIARSLGAKARLRERQTYYTHLGEKKAGRPSFQVRIWHQKLSAFFRLPRKKERATDSWNGGAELTREVVKVELVGEEEATCIQVDSPSSLYVAGEDLVVTHNSALILGLALTAHQRTLIIRRESTQLRGLIDDIARTIRTRNGLNNQAGQWRIPTTVTPRHLRESKEFSGQLIEFGGVPNPGDEERHQGIAHDLLAFDEVTQLPEYVIDYLSSWNRTTDSKQRCRMILTSNPPTPSTVYAANNDGGQWLIRRYAPWLDPQYRDPYGFGPAKPGELRYFVSIGGKEQEWPDPFPFYHEIKFGKRKGEREAVYPRSRTFIPALPTDNPHLGEDYISVLQKHPEPLRSALLYGDFSVSLSDRPMQLIPSAWVRAATLRYREMQTKAPTGDPTHNRTLSALGVDVARGGADSTIVFRRYGAFVAEPILIGGADASTGPEVASRLLQHRRDNCPIVVDANGVGASVYDHLVQALHLDNVFAYVGSKKSQARDVSNKLGFVNLRSERYWKLREMLDPASPTKIAIPDDPELVEELLAMTWEEQSMKIKVITKKDLVKVLGRSPDKADALVLSFAGPSFDDEELELPQSQENQVYTRMPTRAEDRRMKRARDLGPDDLGNPRQRMRW
jgi:hypothetical protein